MARPPVPPRNWRRWGFAYFAHAATGAIAGAGVGFAVGAGYWPATLTHLLAIRSDWRQYVEFLRREDTPGRDMGDSIAGYCCGLLAGFAVGAIGRTWPGCWRWIPGCG